MHLEASNKLMLLSSTCIHWIGAPLAIMEDIHAVETCSSYFRGSLL